ncbi:MAG: Maf family protein [Spirochaetota bacterium]
MNDSRSMPAGRLLPPRIVLASASPRRRELLLQIGIESEVHPSHIDETAVRHDDPAMLAVRLAEAKARETAGMLGRWTLPILAADTVVAVGDEILEKPTDRGDARRMLESLSGRTHRVVTGIAVVAPAEGLPRASTEGADGRPDLPMQSAFAESAVTFCRLSTEEIVDYLDSREWEGVAGAYRIQGLAGRYVTDLRGSYSNVVGLPLHLVYSILTQYA